jgi:Arc/MetJ-type ribon-helix-helix transcriptional regulator
MSMERDPMVATRVPNEMMELMERRMRAGNYASTSEYIRDLIRRDLEERGLFGSALVVGVEADDAEGRAA